MAKKKTLTGITTSELKDIKKRFSEVYRLVTNSYCAYDALPGESQLGEPSARAYLDSVVLPHLVKLEKLVQEYDKKRKYSYFEYTPAEEDPKG